MEKPPTPLDDRFISTLQECISRFEWYTRPPNPNSQAWAEWREYANELAANSVTKRFHTVFPPPFSFDDMEKSRPWFWSSKDHFLDECVRVLARLTEKPDGALVSLWDLLDEREYRRFIVVREIYAWTVKKAQPPVPYDPEAAIFTKTPGTFNAIQDLLRAFHEWESSGVKKS